MSYNFEIRLQELGECVNNLSNETQHLQNIFNICINDFMANKLYNMENYEQLISPQPQITPIRKVRGKTLSIENEDRTNKFNLDQILLEPNIEDINYENNNEILEIQDDLGECNEISLDQLKRSSPEGVPLYGSIEVCDIFNPNNSILYTHKNPSKSTKHKPFNSKYIKIEQVFSTLTKDEKARIIYDKVILGSSKFERKWGIPHKLLKNYKKSMNEILQTEEQKAMWMEGQRSKLEEKLSNMNIDIITSGIEEILNMYNNNNNNINREKDIYICNNQDPNIQNIQNILNIRNIRNISPQPSTTIGELCEVAFDRGLAVAGTRYRINIFELEFLLQNMCPEKWDEMVLNKWYSVNEREVGLNKIDTETKMEIARLSGIEGMVYISKKFGVNKDTLGGYRRLLLRQMGKVGGGFVE